MTMNLNTTDHFQLPDMSDAYKQVQDLAEKKTDKPKRWQDDDGDGKWYEKSDVDGKISKREKNSRSHDCAKKVKSEEYGIGTPVKGMHDLDENGVVQHYDVMFEHGIEKNVSVSSLEILEGGMHDHVIHDEDNVINEISADTALAASKKADIERGKKAVAGDKEGAAKKSAQAVRLYKAQAKKRLNKEETDILNDLSESGLFSDDEIETILNMNEED